MRWRAGLVALLAVAAAAGARPAGAAEGAEFSLRPDRPATAEARDRSYIVKAVAPGAELADRVLAVNLTDKPLDLEVAPADASITPEGVFAPGTTATAVGSWITATPGQVRVPPHGTVPVDVRIRVPADAAAGDHIAAVVARKAGEPSGSGNVRVVQRVGVRVYLTVQPTDESSRRGALGRQFEFRSLRWAGDAFEAEVANTGDLLVEPLGTVDVRRGGLGATAEVPVLGTVPPGESRTFRVSPPADLEPGTYDGTVRLHLVQGGDDQARTVTFTLDGPLHTGRPPVAPAKDKAFPWWLMVIAVAALGAVAVEARRRLAA